MTTMNTVHIARGRSILRRTLLRAAGAAIALPLLDAMIPAVTGNAPPMPRRSSTFPL